MTKGSQYARRRQAMPVLSRLGLVAGFVGVSLVGAEVPAAAIGGLPAVTTTININPTAGSAGTKIVVSGSGFGASETVGITFDTTAVASATSNATGSFSGASFKVPQTASPGAHMVAARGRRTGRSAKKPFQLFRLVRIVDSSSSCASLFCFQPATTGIRSGSTVKWSNRSAGTHTVTRCTVAACGVSGGTGTDSGPGSGDITPGGSYQFAFHGAGSYVYYCNIHGYGVMHGTITVS